MQCFCLHQKTEDVEADKLYHLYDSDNNIIFEQPICKEFFKDKLWSMILGQSISFIIIGVNVILKIIIIELVCWVGEDTQSQ